MIAQQIPVVVIAAMDSQRGIGRDNRMAWKIDDELAFFHKMTTNPRRLYSGHTDHQNVVIMGRKTWESIPPAHLPMTGRLNIVLSRNRSYTAKGATVVHSFEKAFKVAVQAESSYVFIIGGGDVYRQAVHLREVDGVILTYINGDYDCDVFFPEIPEELQAHHWSLGTNLSGDVGFIIQGCARCGGKYNMPSLTQRLSP